MTLRELLRAHRAATRETWTEMSERAEKNGHPISQQHLGRIAKNGLKEVPTSDTIRAIAAAVGEDPGIIYRAAGEELGFSIEGPYDLGDNSIKVFLALTADRTDAEKAALLAAVRAQVEILDLYRPTTERVTERNGSSGHPSETEG